MSQIITFYSYKGGVGRSMALANVATLLSKWGKKVLMIDWDLEAPGLEKFFKDYTPKVDWSQQKGVLEWLYARQEGKKAKWQDWVVRFKTDISTTDLHLLPSGKATEQYSELLRDFDVTRFYEQHDGGNAIEQFRKELLAAYDYILIDSRTGVTDFGGICTIQLPDIVVMLFTPTEQGLMGTKKIAERVLKAHQGLPFDRFNLLICPIPSKFDSITEFKESQSWMERFSKELAGFYDDWFPKEAKLIDFIQAIKIPYISYFSFGEKLPVIEQGVSDPAGLGYAYESLASILANHLDDVGEFIQNRESYIQIVSGLNVQKDEKHNSPLNNKKVRIYISNHPEQGELKNGIQGGIGKLFPRNTIEFLDNEGLKIGESMHQFYLNKIDLSDIVLILIGKRYFIKPEMAAIEVNKEYIAIQGIAKSHTIPIFLRGAHYANTSSFVQDRKGIYLQSLEDNELVVEKVVDELYPLILDIQKRKSSTKYLTV